MPNDSNMPEPELTFNQYTVIIFRITELDKKLDKIDAQVAVAMVDHEKRLRTLESRLTLIVSLGMVSLLLAVGIGYLIARGIP